MTSETMPFRWVCSSIAQPPAHGKLLLGRHWRCGRVRKACAGGWLALLPLAVMASLGPIAGASTPSLSLGVRTSDKTTRPTRKADDSKAEAAVNLALTAIGIDHRTFGNYDVVNPTILGNFEHALRKVRYLTASGSGQTFRLSVRSASGTTFEVSGDNLLLHRTCTPIGPDCAHGVWSGSTTLKVSKGSALTATQKNMVSTTLTASVNHYAAVLALGEKILGNTQYASAAQGDSAFHNPNSAASRFSTFQKTYDPEGDESYLEAFKRADSYYTAANEPTAITVWRDDMTSATGALAAWVPIAVGWQIRQYSTAQLHVAERRVREDLATARRDVAKVLAESR